MKPRPNRFPDVNMASFFIKKYINYEKLDRFLQNVGNRCAGAVPGNLARERSLSYILELCEANISDFVTFSKIFVFSQFTVTVFQLFESAVYKIWHLMSYSKFLGL